MKMAFKSVLCASALLLTVLAWGSTASAQWVSVGDGIDYQEFNAAGPNRLFVSRMARNNPNATVDTTLADGGFNLHSEIIPVQAEREEDAITWWGGSWGARNRVVAAINGGLITTSGEIDGGQIKSGWYAHMFTSIQTSHSGPAWKNDRSAFHGECVIHNPAKVFIRFMSNGGTQSIDGINRNPGSSDLVMFTPHWGQQTPTGSRTEVLVEMTKPNLTTSGAGYTSGIIRSVSTTGATWIPFDHLVLSAGGSVGTTLRNNAVVGSEIRIYQELTELNQADVQGNNACQTPTGRDWSNVFASINSNYRFLQDGVVRVPDVVAHPGYQGLVIRNPRTAICWNADYVFFVVNDGRSTISVGMNMVELGNWAQSVLGATDGANLDGGGSSTMVINHNITNVPSNEQPARPVINGVMMVNVLPMAKSTQYATGQTVYTLDQAACRLGPGTNYATRATIVPLSMGTVVNHSINGVYAKGAYWWKCDFGGMVGWIAETSLTPVLADTPPSIAKHPSNQSVSLGRTATFSVTAYGSTPLTYQWQKNNANISDGGHYAGCNTTVLTISGCDTNDAASYRCVATNAFGSATSNSATLTVTAATGPTITQQPAAQVVCTGADAAFSAAAIGVGELYWQWQRNGVNISEGQHYAGVNTSTLNVIGATAPEAGNYSCVVSDAYGNTSTNAASLSVLSCAAGCIENPGFEEGVASGAGLGWTKCLIVGSFGSNLASSDETTEKHSGSHCQKIYSANSGYYGGVYQQFAAIPGQSYTVSGWFKATSPGGTGIAEGYFGVDPAGGTDPTSSTILWGSKPFDYWSQKTFTVTAQSNYVTVYGVGHSTRSDKSANIYIDDFQMRPGPPALVAPQAVSPTSIRWQWADSGIETGYRVRDTAGVDKSGLLPMDTTQWVEATGISPNTQYTRRIYAINNCGESNASADQTAYSLSVAPTETSLTAAPLTPNVNQVVTWTAVGGFGPGTLQYFRWAWDREPTHTWSGTETQWSTGTIATTPTAPGNWYLHVQGYNAANVANGSYDYLVATLGSTIPPDLDKDGDVDLHDFDLFQICLSGPMIQATQACQDRDFDLDNDVDQTDFSTLQRCYSGADISADPNCASNPG